MELYGTAGGKWWKYYGHSVEKYGRFFEGNTMWIYIYINDIDINDIWFDDITRYNNDVIWCVWMSFWSAVAGALKGRQKLKDLKPLGLSWLTLIKETGKKEERIRIWWSCRSRMFNLGIWHHLFKRLWKLRLVDAAALLLILRAGLVKAKAVL